MMSNIGHLFYKEYFKGLEFNNGKPKFDGSEISSEIFNALFPENLVKGSTNSLYKKLNGSKTFLLRTTYPGLLIGSGYAHEIGGKTAENELKLGFYFDYTTGLPIIPGSSIKGVLRDAFKKANGEYVKELIKELPHTESIDLDINLLIDDIFEGKCQGDPKPIYQRDIFFDAFPVKSYNKNNKFLANDYITPHKEPLKNPVPLQFLKVLPGVTFRFNFILHATKDINGTVLLTAENKLKLFKRILLDLGIGAKTNVGYGQFEDFEDFEDIEEREVLTKEIIPEIFYSKVEKNDAFNGQIVAQKEDKYFYIKFELERERVIIRKRKSKMQGMKVGDTVRILFQEKPNKGTSLNFKVTKT